MSEFDLGFLGGGQLARMSIMAAQRMGLRCLSLEQAEDTPAAQIAPALVGRLDDIVALAEVFRRCHYVTLENEFVPADALQAGLDLASRDEACLRPGVRTLATIQDKLKQRKAYEAAGVPSPPAIAFEPERPHALDDIELQFGFPLVAKARFGGYDGKGTRTIRSRAELDEFGAWYLERGDQLGSGWLLEAFVPFRRELAVMVYRSETEMGTFPTMETLQTDHVCDTVFPAGVDASGIAKAAVTAVSGFGLFGVELFEVASGEFLVNEIAPRPHNTGHYTLDWGGVSQFEQHVRLAWRLPCRVAEGGETCMVNLLGQPGANSVEAAIRAAVAAVPAAQVHWYGKRDAKPGRKMGHINVTGENCVTRAREAREVFYRAWNQES